MAEMINLRKALKFQLPVIKSGLIISWFKEVYFQFDPHHYISRSVTDYLLVPLTRAEHQDRHKNPDKYELEDLIKSLKILFEFIQWLEQKYKEAIMPRESKEVKKIKARIEELDDQKTVLQNNILENRAEIEKIETAIAELYSIIEPEEKIEEGKE